MADRCQDRKKRHGTTKTWTKQLSKTPEGKSATFKVSGLRFFSFCFFFIFCFAFLDIFLNYFLTPIAARFLVPFLLDKI